MKKLCCFLLVTFMILGTIGIVDAKPKKDAESMEELGELIYFDQYLSANKNQSCASCHDPNTGFVDPLNIRLPETFVSSAGSDPTLFGGRNSPMAAYALNSPNFFFNAGEGLWIGGQFWDGRADDLAEQAKGPFLNPVEMGMPDRAAVVDAMFAADNKNKNAYEVLFPAAFPGITSASSVDEIYNAMADAIAAFESTFPFNEFSSKFDHVLNQGYVTWDGTALITADAGGLITVFSTAEIDGMNVFFDDTDGGGQCVLCHMPPDFTDFTYDNLGIPTSKNDLIRKNPVDLGLANTITNLDELYPHITTTAPEAAAALQEGKFKVMTVRNVELTAPYGHNGYFATLKDIVHFYNTRDVDPMWEKPEVPQNVNFNELGNLGLSSAQEADLVAFLKTLTDGYKP